MCVYFMNVSQMNLYYTHLYVHTHTYTHIHTHIQTRKDMFIYTANPTWGDIFECCFKLKAQSSNVSFH